MPQTVSAVPINRALSKLGVLSRSDATDAVRAGRVRVDGRLVTNPAAMIVPERARIEVDGVTRRAARWRTIVFHKPRGVVTTRRDPEGRRTVFDVLGDGARGLAAVGRLDLATSGLLLLTTDTRFANWLTDSANAIPRVYLVTARGGVTQADVAALTSGVGSGRECLRAQAAAIRKASSRESHLVVELGEGKNREVRRLFAAIGHEVTRLKRVAFGGLELGDLAPGEWRELTRRELRAVFPSAPLR
jgi:23S rRNA pseudouridine2605 synthase